MDLCNRSAMVVICAMAIAMVLSNQYGFAYDSAQMHLVMGVTIIPLSLILELNKTRAVFMFAPLWVLGFIPLTSGLYRLGDWPFLFILIPVFIVCRVVLGSIKQEKIHHSIEVTHELLNVDPDALRHEIEENRSHHSKPQMKHR